jgi:hypothetical protein
MRFRHAPCAFRFTQSVVLKRRITLDVRSKRRSARVWNAGECSGSILICFVVFFASKTILVLSLLFSPWLLERAAVAILGRRHTEYSCQGLLVFFASVCLWNSAKLPVGSSSGSEAISQVKL